MLGEAESVRSEEMRCVSRELMWLRLGLSGLFVDVVGLFVVFFVDVLERKKDEGWFRRVVIGWFVEARDWGKKI